MKFLKIDATPIFFGLLGIGLMLWSVLNDNEWHRVQERGVEEPGTVDSGAARKSRRGFSYTYQLTVMYGEPRERKTTRSFDVSEDFYRATLRTDQSWSGPGLNSNRPRLTIRQNPDSPKEAWIVGAEPDKPLPPELFMIGGAVLVGFCVWRILVLKQTGRLYRYDP